MPMRVRLGCRHRSALPRTRAPLLLTLLASAPRCRQLRRRIKDMKDYIVEHGCADPESEAAAANAFIDAWSSFKKGGAKPNADTIVFTDDEEALFASAVGLASDGGFRITVEMVQELMADTLTARAEEEADSEDGEPPRPRVVSRRHVKKWMSKHGLRR